MSFAKWWFNRFRAFRSFKWYYNPRWLNIELGEQAEPAFRQQLREKISNPDGKTYVPPELEEIRQAY